MSTSESIENMENLNTQKDSFPKISVDSRYDIEFLKNQFKQSIKKICDDMENNNNLYPQNFDDIKISKKRKRVTKEKLKKKWRNELDQTMNDVCIILIYFFYIYLI